MGASAFSASSADRRRASKLPASILGGIAVEGGGEAPRELRLLPIGRTEVERNNVASVTLTRDDAEALASWFKRLGRRLAIDYEHQSIPERNRRADGLAPAAGWIGGIEARADGLYATGIEWTAAAQRMIREREYLYFSPVVFWADASRQRIVGLGPVALTNDPSLNHLPALAASGLQLSTDSTDDADDLCQSVQPVDGSSASSACSADFGLLAQALAALGVIDADLSQIETALSEVNLPRVAAALGLPETSSREVVMREFKRLLAAGGAAGGASDGAGGGGPTAPAVSGPPPAPFRAIAAELLPADKAAGVADQAGLVSALRAEIDGLKARAIASDASAAALTALQSEFKALKVRADESEFRQIVDGGAGKGRITPEMEPAWKSLFMADRTQFDALLEKQPVLVSGTSAFAAEKPGAAAGGAGGKPAFMVEAEKIAAERKIGIGDALSAVAREKPELYTAFKAELPTMAA